MTAGRVGPNALTLGYLGLLPQGLATAAIAVAHFTHHECPLTRVGGFVGVTLVYPWLILAFLGGAWWGLAMRREQGQGLVATIAVAPSLIALGLASIAYWTGRWEAVLVASGIIVMLTLLVDRWLFRRGDAPAGWLALRVPLSIALGGLTILAGALLGPTPARCAAGL